MKLWRISQSVNNDYDTYDSAVVAAETREDARNMHPWNGRSFSERPDLFEGDFATSWCHPDYVTTEYLGETTRGAGVICASFNAG